MRRLAAAALAAVPLLGACQVTTAVGLDANADGSGRVLATITLDKEAADRVPDLSQRLRVDDLRQAGWVVDGPLPAPDGGVVIRATHRFATPAEASGVVEELSGPTGPFQDFRLTRQRSFLRTRLAFRGRVDLSRGLATFSDDELRSRLGGSDLGFDAAQLERRLGQTLDRIFRFRVAARLPGEVTSNATTRAENGATWTPRLGDQVQLEASAESWNQGNLTAAAVSLAAALALVALLVRRFLTR